MVCPAPGSSLAAVRAASGWNEWQGATYISAEAWDEFVDALAERDCCSSCPEQQRRRRAAAPSRRGRLPARPATDDSQPIDERDRLGDLVADIATCRRCPRLVAWREEVARTRVARHRDSVYWGRPVPGFGDPAARLLLVGLAPAAHGGNRSGRVFTGDNPGGSGELLFEALHRAGYSPRPRSLGPADGLVCTTAYIAAVNRCAPPANKPTVEERDAACPSSFASCAC